MLADFETNVAAAVRDDVQKLATNDFVSAIEQAVRRYSKDRPRIKVEDVASPGGNILPLPLAWEADFSQINSVEYPVGKMPPSFIEAGGWAMYAAPNGLMIQVAAAIPAAAPVRLNYSIAHVLSGVVDTIPAGDADAVVCYAASILCDQLANLYSNDQDSTIRADSVQHITKAGEFARRAKTLRQRYYDEIGVDAKRNVAAGAVVNLDLPSSVGRDRLTHPRRFR